jgi:hypothetical protein
MRIGLDFDNTIVSYDQLFHKVALERSLISPEVPINKVAVRDHLRRAGQEDIWTEMQGYVYGARMDEASAYSGAIDALKLLKLQGHKLFIVSHKTQFPYAGEQYDLHQSSSKWIVNQLQLSDSPLIDHVDVFFNATKAEKIQKIEQLECDIFLDDLPEILSAEQFPKKTIRCLFDPEGHHLDLENDVIKHHRSWKSFSDWVLQLKDLNDAK